MLSGYRLAIYIFLIIHPKRNLLDKKSVIEVLNSVYFRIVFCKMYLFMRFVLFLVDAIRYLFIYLLLAWQRYWRRYYLCISYCPIVTAIIRIFLTFLWFIVWPIYIYLFVDNGFIMLKYLNSSFCYHIIFFQTLILFEDRSWWR